MLIIWFPTLPQPNIYSVQNSELLLFIFPQNESFDC